MYENTFLVKTFIKAHAANRLTQLLILLSFLITFIIVRVITILQVYKILPNQHGAVHIHHLVPGILLLLISGYFGLAYWTNEKFRRFMAVMFGIGAALAIDEYALWLYLKDVYWLEQGRNSIDAIIITGCLFSLVYVISAIHDHYVVKKLFKK